MATSCTTGAVGRSNACWPAAVEVSFRRTAGLGLRRPRLPATTCNSSRLSTRSLVRLRFGLSSRSAAGASPGTALPAVSATTSPAADTSAALDASNSAATRSASAAATFSAASARSRASASTFAFTAASFSAAARSTSSFWSCRSPRRTRVRRFFTSTWTVLAPPVREVCRTWLVVRRLRVTRCPGSPVVPFASPLR